MKANTSLSIATAVVAFGAAFAAIGSPALAATAQERALTLAKTTCTDVTKVRTDSEAAGCISSLLDSLRAKARGEAYAADDADCSRKGLVNGAPEFSACVLDLNRTYASSVRDKVIDDNPPETVLVEPTKEGNRDDRFPGTFAARHRREEDSCARLGLDPSSTPFLSCVAGLDIAIVSADTPRS